MTREEAIKKVSSWSLPKDTREILEALAPELAESEDERIRKAIIELLKEVGQDDTGVSENVKCMLAWLEKQKYDRMKPIYDAKESFESALEKAWNDYHNGYENVDKLEDDYVECAHAKGFREGFLYGLEKQKEPHYTKRNALFDKCVAECDPEIMHRVSDEIDEMLEKEQKPNYCHHEVDETGWPDEYRKAYYDGWNNCNIQHELLNSQNKPAEWSEEDKQWLSEVYFAIDHSMYSEVERQAMKEYIDFLRSQSKPIQEWSEEDEDFINMLILHFNYLIDKGGSSVETYKSYIEKLKSLRPQPKAELSEDVKRILDDVSHILIGLNYKQVAKEYKQAIEKLLYSRPSWKPSEEQMNGLAHAINLDVYDAKRYGLDSLYNNLKKLTHE